MAPGRRQSGMGSEAGHSEYTHYKINTLFLQGRGEEGNQGAGSRVVGYDYLQSAFLHGVAKCVIGQHDLVQREMMGDQLAGLEFPRLHRFKQHGGCDGIDQPGGQSNILRPKFVEV